MPASGIDARRTGGEDDEASGTDARGPVVGAAAGGEAAPTPLIVAVRAAIFGRASFAGAAAAAASPRAGSTPPEGSRRWPGAGPGTREAASLPPREVLSQRPAGP